MNVDMPAKKAKLIPSEKFYDRQIRLWGKEAQEKLSGYSVRLLVHNEKYISTAFQETFKNLLLTGVGTIWLDFSYSITEDIVSKSIFFTIDDIGEKAEVVLAKKAFEINHRVNIEVNSPEITSDLNISFGISDKRDILTNQNCLTVLISGLKGALITSNNIIDGEEECSDDFESPFLYPISAVIGGIASQKAIFIAIGRIEFSADRYIYSLE
eukprot:GHVP01053968.1.p1 GENE.GHVP01053968.1~~GHVP01053968.1.p1  ORF type:complete len:212 (+),score=37.81 GHVP01053968.1:3-638(+)